MSFIFESKASRSHFQISQTSINLIIYAFPVFIGFIVRLLFLMDPSIWADEGQHILIALAPDIFEMRETYATTAHDQPYGMYVLLHSWIEIFGVTPLAFRAFSLFNSTLGILTTGLAAKMIFVSSLLMALSPFAIRYSFDVTPYCILNAFIPLSIGLFIRGFINKNPIPGIGLILVNSFLLNIHYFSYFFVAAQIITAVIIARKDLRKFLPGILIACGIYAVASLPVLLLLDLVLAKGNHWWIEADSRSYFSIFLSLFAYGLLEKIIVSSVLIFGTIFIIFKFKKLTYSQKYALIPFAVLILTTLFLVVISKFLFWDVFGHERYFMVIFPALILSIVIATFWGFNGKSVRIVLILIVTLMMAVSIALHMPKQNVHDFKSAVEFIEKSNEKSENNILVIPECCYWAILYYLEYYQIKMRVEPINNADLMTKKEPLDYLKEKAKELNSKKIYVILYYESLNYTNQLGSKLSKISDPNDKKEFKGVKVLEFSLR